MGRYAQRRRGGGGPPTSAALITIDLAERVDVDQIVATFSAGITDTDFGLPDFFTEPTEDNPITIAQESANQLRLTWAAPIDTETDLIYQGSVPGIQTPQSVPIT